MTLSDEIVQVLTTPATSAEITALIGRISAEHESLAEHLERLNEHALDPLTTGPATAKARIDTESVGFTLKRLTAAHKRLAERRAKVEADEREKAADERRMAALKLRDEAVEAMAAYETHARAIAEIAAKIQRADAAIGAVNLEAATGSAIEFPEKLARGREYNDTGFGALYASVRLPAFKSGSQGTPIWPRA